MKQSILQYLLQNLLAFDQQLNTLLGGWADETLSARAYRSELSGRFFGRITRPVIDTIFVSLTLGRERDHCAQAFRSEIARTQNHPTYRGM